MSQNKHITHLEDLLLERGAASIKDIVRIADEVVRGAARVTVKWDGAPAIVTGVDPQSGRFFIATKHAAFAKNMRLAFSPEDIAAQYEDPALVEKLTLAFNALSGHVGGVWQGDILFWPSLLREQRINGLWYLTFKPNTITYAVPMSYDLREFQRAPIGVAFHTKYVGSGPVNTMSADYGTNFDWLPRLDAPWLVGSEIDTPIFTGYDRRAIAAMQAQVEKGGTEIEGLLDVLAANSKPLDLGYLFKVYVNTLIREGRFSGEALFKGFGAFVDQRFKEKQATLKTSEAMARYEIQRNATTSFLVAFRTKFLAFVNLYITVIQLKAQLMIALDREEPIPTFLGKTPCGPEGYVVTVDNMTVKLVNRFTFSVANFNNMQEWK